MDKLLLVDGSNLLFQMFYGMPARIVGKSGKLIHGTLGFVGALLKILKMTEPTHLIVLFDGECENERKAIDGDYKANRPDYSEMAEEETPFCQLPDIYAALDYLKIAHTETRTCETDDVIAAYALQNRANMQVVISSFDSDFFQLVDSNTSVLRYRGENTLLCDEGYVQENFGVSASRYADFKSLVGDTADNVKGVPMVGMKTAAKLLNEFESLENLLANTDKIQRAALRNSIEGQAHKKSTADQIKRLRGSPLPRRSTPFYLRRTENGGSIVGNRRKIKVFFILPLVIA